MGAGENKELFPQTKIPQESPTRIIDFKTEGDIHRLQKMYMACTNAYAKSIIYEGAYVQPTKGPIGGGFYFYLSKEDCKQAEKGKVDAYIVAKVRLGVSLITSNSKPYTYYQLSSYYCDSVKYAMLSVPVYAVLNWGQFRIKYAIFGEERVMLQKKPFIYCPFDKNEFDLPYVDYFYQWADKDHEHKNKEKNEEINDTKVFDGKRDYKENEESYIFRMKRILEITEEHVVDNDRNYEKNAISKEKYEENKTLIEHRSEDEKKKLIQEHNKKREVILKSMYTHNDEIRMSYPIDVNKVTMRYHDKRQEDYKDVPMHHKKHHQSNVRQR